MKDGLTPREMFWELAESASERAWRAARLRLVYALADPGGWDARRLAGMNFAFQWSLVR